MALNFSSSAGSRLTAPGNLNGFGSAGCIACWFKTSSSTANTILVSGWDGSSRNGFGLQLNTVTTGAVRGACANGAGGVPVALLSSTTTFNDGNWHHAAFNFNAGSGSAQELFVDGVSEASGTASGAWTFTASSGMVMGGANTFWASLNGDMADVGLWSRNLTAGEVAALARGFAPPRVALQNLERYYPLVRDHLVDRVNGGTASFSVTGTAGVTHPRIVGGLI